MEVKRIYSKRFHLCRASRMMTVIHSIPRSEETRAELSQIAWVPCQVRFLLTTFNIF